MSNQNQNKRVFFKRKTYPINHDSIQEQIIKNVWGLDKIPKNPSPKSASHEDMSISQEGRINVSPGWSIRRDSFIDDAHADAFERRMDLKNKREICQKDNKYRGPILVIGWGIFLMLCISNITLPSSAEVSGELNWLAKTFLWYGIFSLFALVAYSFRWFDERRK